MLKLNMATGGDGPKKPPPPEDGARLKAPAPKKQK